MKVSWRKASSIAVGGNLICLFAPQSVDLVALTCCSFSPFATFFCSFALFHGKQYWLAPVFQYSPSLAGLASYSHCTLTNHVLTNCSRQSHNIHQCHYLCHLTVTVMDNMLHRRASAWRRKHCRNWQVAPQGRFQHVFVFLSQRSMSGVIWCPACVFNQGHLVPVSIIHVM